MDMEKYGELVESIYDAPFKDAGWQEVVSKLLKALDSTAVGFFVQTKESGLGNHSVDGIKDGQTGLYEGCYVPGARGLLPPTRRGGEALMRPWTAVQSIFDDNRHDLAFHYPSRTGHCPSHEIHLYRSLSQHLQKAVQIGEQLDQSTTRNAVFEDVLDQLRLGVIFLDQHGRIIDMNCYARQLLQQDDGLFEKSSKLELTQKKYRNQLRTAISQVSATGKSSAFNLPRQNQSPLSVSVIPSMKKQTSLNPHINKVTLFISDPDDREISDAEELGKRWGLTPLESQITLLLIKGKKIKQIATELELTENTARWYSKQIMSKVGVKCQADLRTKLMKDIAFLVDT